MVVAAEVAVEFEIGCDVVADIAMDYFAVVVAMFSIYHVVVVLLSADNTMDCVVLVIVVVVAAVTVMGSNDVVEFHHLLNLLK